MKKRFLCLLCVMALCLGLLPATASAEGPNWIYDPTEKTLTNEGDQSVILNYVTAEGTNLTIGGGNANFSGRRLDLSGAIKSADG